MHRDKFTAKLVRIVESIESGKLPMDMRELYVFGSYSRGVIEPGDLDLIIVHGRGRQEIDWRVDETLQKSHSDILARMRAATVGKQVHPVVALWNGARARRRSIAQLSFADKRSSSRCIRAGAARTLRAS